ncbi:MAG: ATP-binding protein [Nannocystaceae bacterium]
MPRVPPKDAAQGGAADPDASRAPELTAAQVVARLERLHARVAAVCDEPTAQAPAADLGALLDRLDRDVDAALEALAAERGRNRRMDLQFGELVEVVTALAGLDYSQQATVYEGQDDSINALAIGLNMMGEELANSTAEIIRARDEALAANRAKTTFLANMSHEFRTPLNAIIGYSELLYEEQAGSADPLMLRDLGRINSAARHVLNLIQDTLDISKIEADKIELDIRPVDIRLLVDDVTATVLPTAEMRRNAIECEVSIQTEHILGDPTRLRQILLNLLSNACKFTHEGTVTLAVAERVTARERWLDFSVSDTGIGIPREKQQRIFDAFTQADGSTTRIYGGTGLGLTISRRLCEMMGGTLAVTSEVAVGSTFTATIPVRAAPAPAPSTPW